MKRDIQFVKHVLQKQHSVDTMVAFIDFANTQDTNLNGLSEIIKNIVGSIDESIPEWQKYRLEEGLIHVVIKLIDASRDDIKSTEDCLDILDFIYQKRILTESAVYKVFDGVE